MQLLDLFAGIGGFSLAGHWMGWETAAFVEKEPFCQKVLRKNFGAEIEIHDDICNFSGKPFRGRVDIVTGGFPCQPFSSAGKQKGRHDERHLFPEMLRVIREVRPRWVVAENVRRLLTIESGLVYAEIVASLEGEGFEVVTFCVPASAVEAPHRRDRLWIVAHNSKRSRRPGRARRNASFSNGDRSNDGLSKSSDCDVAYTSSVRRNERRAELERQQRSTTPISTSSTLTNSEGERRRTSWPHEAQDGANTRIVDAACYAADADDPGSRASRSGINGERASAGEEREQSQSEPNGHDRHASYSCDSRLQGGELTGASGEGTRPSRSATELDRDAWREPWIEAAARLCGIHDGLPDWLHHDRGLNDATITRTVTRQNLHDLRPHLQQKEIQERLGRYFAIQEPENLLAVLRELERRSDDGRLSLPSRETAEIELRALWNDERSGRSPQRREYQEQFAREHSDPLPFLSYEIALATESAIQRFKVGADTSNRVHRLKALGNSIVPQIAFEIFRAIEAAESVPPAVAGGEV